jgi:hypothetical protein
MMVWVGFGGDVFHLKHSDHGQETDEKKEQEKEKADRSDEEGNINPGGREVTPG